MVFWRLVFPWFSGALVHQAQGALTSRKVTKSLKLRSGPVGPAPETHANGFVLQG